MKRRKLLQFSKDFRPSFTLLLILTIYCRLHKGNVWVEAQVRNMWFPECWLWWKSNFPGDITQMSSSRERSRFLPYFHLFAGSLSEKMRMQCPWKNIYNSGAPLPFPIIYEISSNPPWDWKKVNPRNEYGNWGGRACRSGMEIIIIKGKWR